MAVIYVNLLDNSCVQDFCAAWLKGIRRIWNLPYNSHGDNLWFIVSGDIPIWMKFVGDLCGLQLLACSMVLV